MDSKFYGFSYTLPAKSKQDSKKKGIKNNYKQSNRPNDQAPLREESYEDSRNLVIAYQNGDVQALNKLVEVNEDLVGSIAKNYAGLLEAKDLMQEGKIGLIKAANKFDASYPNKFSTYAVWWIKNAILKAINNNTSTIRIPGHRRDDLRKFNRAINQSLNEFGIIDETRIRKEVGLNESEYKELMRIKDLKTVSADAPASQNNTTPLISCLPTPKQTVDAIMNNDDFRKELVDLLDTELNDNQKYVIIERFGLGNGDVKTLSEIGKVLGVSKERIRQIEVAALSKLKKPVLKQYLQEN